MLGCGRALPRTNARGAKSDTRGMRFSKKVTRAIWIAVSVVGIASMIAFTLLPVIYR